MRFTYRIMALPLLTAVTFTLVFVALFANIRDGNRLLQRLQTESLTAVNLTHGLEIEAMRIHHGLDLASALADPTQIAATEPSAARFCELLDSGRRLDSVAVDDLDAIAAAFDHYDALARRLATVLIGNPDRRDDPAIEAAGAATTAAYRDLRAALDRLNSHQVQSVRGALADTRDRLAQRTRQATLVAAVSVIMLIFMAAGAILSIVRPLRRFRVAAAAVAEGDLDQDIGYRSDDDLGQLATSFRDMQRALEADLARREEIEHALRDSQQRLTLALDAANDGIWDIDMPQDRFYCSDRFAEILGYESADKPRTVGEVSAMLRGVDDGEMERVFSEERADGREASVEARLQRRDGRWAWVLIKGRAVDRLPDGQPRRLVGTISDITERKAAEEELRRAQDRALQSEKLASLGRLVAGLAHELNSPLGALVSSSDLTVRSAAILRERMNGDDCPADLEADPRLQRALVALEQSSAGTAAATARLDELLGSLKRFTALDQADLQEADVNELLDATVTVTSEIQQADIVVRRDYGDLPRILCHPAQLNQLFLVLIRNAVEAMPDGGTLTLQTAPSEAETTSEAETLSDAETIQVAITDTGRGIPADQLATLFEPGFHAGRQRMHLGWGLVTASRIVAEHGGQITAASERGRGSTFAVTLPVRPRATSEGQ